MKNLILIIIFFILFIQCKGQENTIKTDTLKRIVIILDSKSNYKEFNVKSDSINFSNYYLQWPLKPDFKKYEFIFNEENNKIKKKGVKILDRGYHLNFNSTKSLSIKKSTLEKSYYIVYLSDFVYFEYGNLIKGLKSAGNIIYITNDISNDDEIIINECLFTE